MPDGCVDIAPTRSTNGADASRRGEHRWTVELYLQHQTHSEDKHTSKDHYDTDEYEDLAEVGACAAAYNHQWKGEDYEEKAEARHCSSFVMRNYSSTMPTHAMRGYPGRHG